jgi:hypothetical protein
MAKRLAMVNNGVLEAIPNTEVYSGSTGTTFTFRNDESDSSVNFNSIKNEAGEYDGFKLDNKDLLGEYDLFEISKRNGYINNVRVTPVYKSGVDNDWVWEAGVYYWLCGGGGNGYGIGPYSGFDGNALQYQSHNPLANIVNDGREKHTANGYLCFKYVCDCPVEIKIVSAKTESGLIINPNVIISTIAANVGEPKTIMIPYNVIEAYSQSDLISYVTSFSFRIVFEGSSYHNFIIDEVYTTTNITNSVISWDVTSKVSIPYGITTSNIECTSATINTLSSTNINTSSGITTNLTSTNITSNIINVGNIKMTSSVGIINTTNTNFIWNDVGTTNLTYGVIIGWGARSSNYNGTVIGREAISTGNSSSVYGYGACSYSHYSTSIGNYAYTNAEYSTAIGYGASASGIRSTALGYGSTVTTSYEMRLGNSTTTVKLGNGATVTSDIRDKVDIQENELGLKFINTINTYKWKDNNRDKYFITKKDDTTGSDIKILDDNGLPIIDEEKYKNAEYKGKRWHRGVVAQDINKLVDSTIFSAVKDTTVNNKYPHIEELTVDYNQFIAPIIKSIQELSHLVTELKDENKKLKNKLGV